ncbi:MAG TPA: GldG family protein, partial [Rhodanobacteraceae bacterium]|nr:GldG family protein [Rhodanobacteraceae bacterium]
MRGAWQGWLYALMCVVIAICIAALSTRFGATADWSAGARATISPQDRALLKQLAGPVKIVAYARPGALRAKTRLLVERFQRFKPDLALEFVDPDVDPIATESAGIQADGEIVLHWHDHTQHVAQLDEQDFADALARLARGGTRLVAFVTGDGERDATGKNAADLGGFVARIADRGVRALPLNLAEAAEVPRNADLVVLASPQAALLPGAVKKLEDYVADGGNLLWLTEPGADDLGLAPLAKMLGVRRLPGGTLVDPQGAAVGGRDPRAVVAARYPAQAITDGFAVNTLFAGVAVLASRPDGQWKVQPILQSSAQSWNRGVLDGPAADMPDPDTGAPKGPLSFGYALSRLSPSPAKTE